MKIMTKGFLCALLLAFLVTLCACGGPKTDLSAWPVRGIATILPMPESGVVDVHSSSDTSFWCSVENADIAAYNAYIDSCIDAGFTVNPENLTNTYIAYNEDGYKINIYFQKSQNEYSISLDASTEETETSAIDETEVPTVSQIEETETPAEAPTDTPTEAPTEVESGISPEFKEAMDSYEEFMDEYVAFMNKYADSDGTDLGMLADYAEFMGKYAEFTEDFARWEDEEMSEEEVAYYLEVQIRVNKKLQEIA